MYCKGLDISHTDYLKLKACSSHMVYNYHFKSSSITVYTQQITSTFLYNNFVHKLLQCCCCCCLMEDLGFIRLVFRHTNTVVVIHWRCGPKLLQCVSANLYNHLLAVHKQWEYKVFFTWNMTMKVCFIQIQLDVQYSFS
jgi:hypothetical protein